MAADLTGLPPLLIQAATGDARLADAKALAMRAREKGVDVRLELFQLMHTPFSCSGGSCIRELHTGLAQSERGRASASARAR